VEVHGLQTQEEAFHIQEGAFRKVDHHQIDHLVDVVAEVVPVAAVVGVLIDGHLIFYHYSFFAPIYQLLLVTKLELRLFPLVGPM